MTIVLTGYIGNEIWLFGNRQGLEMPYVHQEAFILDIAKCYNLTDCNKSTRATPFRSGFPVDNIAPSSLPSNDQYTLLKKYQQISGDLNWLSISTHADGELYYFYIFFKLNQKKKLNSFQNNTSLLWILYEFHVLISIYYIQYFKS